MKEIIEWLIALPIGIILGVLMAIVAFALEGLVLWGLGSFIIWIFGISFTWTYLHGVGLAMIIAILRKIFKK